MKTIEIVRDPDAVQRVEAHRHLRNLLAGKTGRVSLEVLVPHVIGVTEGAPPAVQEEAARAVIRRWRTVERDQLRVLDEPEARTPLRTYRTGRAGEAANPYQTRLAGLDPLDGSCECRDFVRNSLGLCKHVLAVLDHLSRSPTRWLGALRAKRARVRLALRWDPIRPLQGHGPWWERVRLHVDGARVPECLAEWFWTWEPSGDFRPVRLSRPARVLAFVRALNAAKDELEVDPALLGILREQEARLSRTAAVGTEELDEALESLRRPLYAYQLAGVRKAAGAGRLLLADDMGLGKTAQAIAFCHALMKTGRARRALIVVPASLKDQWAREWIKFTDVPVRILAGDPEGRAGMLRDLDHGCLIVNYEQVLRDLPRLQAWAPEIGVLDEAQRIKNWDTKTAHHVKELRPVYRLVLTGTPVENRLEELTSLLEWVDDRALEPKWRLLPLHQIPGDDGRRSAGLRHLHVLRERLHAAVLRRTREEVLSQLPARTDHIVPVEMAGCQKGEHDALDVPIARLLRQSSGRGLTREEFLRLMALLTTQRIISNGLAQSQFPEIWPAIRHRRPSPALLASLSSPKLHEFREIVHALVIEQGRKIVVYSQWRRMLQLAHWAVGDLLERAGRRAAFFTGQESLTSRSQSVVAFHEDPAAMLLFATDTGSVGLNLQRAASCCVNLEVPWNPAVLEQRVARVHRPGQDRPVLVVNLVGVQGIEEKIAGLVENKRALFKSLFDGISEEVHFEASGGLVASMRGTLEAVAIEEALQARDAEHPDELSSDDEVDERLASADESTDLASGSPTAREESELSSLRPVGDP